MICDGCGTALIEWSYQCRGCAGEFCSSCLDFDDQCDLCAMHSDDECVYEDGDAGSDR